MSSGTPHVSDVLIVGAGPAGAAAALRARQARRTVTVVDKATFPRERTCAGWIGPVGVELCRQYGLSEKQIGAHPFTGLRLHSWDLKRSVEVDKPDLSGWVVDRARFDAALLKMAKKAGATVIEGVGGRLLQITESCAQLTLEDDRVVAGRVLIVADGARSQTARMANMLAAGNLPELPQCVFAQGLQKQEAFGFDVVVGASRSGQLVTIVRCGKQVRASLVTRESTISEEQQLRNVVSAAKDAGVLPEDLALELTDAPSPAGMALDMDTHVGKRTLLVGDAGGFVSAFSNEGIYPAMYSGVLAAQTADKALDSDVLQDELMGFSAAWRAELADYLRMPNTDLALLIPLVFNNEQMSERVARAFLLGRAF